MCERIRRPRLGLLRENRLKSSTAAHLDAKRDCLLLRDLREKQGAAGEVAPVLQARRCDPRRYRAAISAENITTAPPMLGVFIAFSLRGLPEAPPPSSATGDECFKVGSLELPPAAPT